ncbi:MAG: hypothetical protein KatS3mg104_2039 [Phycisphaerae bacterium]|nr:MAG: hypothetical protein KatS3mg104_2039 [Phycisphaerae bacterium]
MSDPTGIQFDPVITNPGRLTILTALCSKASLDFVTLRRVTGMTDGNLTTHLRKLASMGFVRIDKTVRSGKRMTSITLNRQRLRSGFASSRLSESGIDHPIDPDARL